ncbi:MAG: putative DNA-binding domain-containing protein [Gammaproteobacteria bacterium]|nr:putative DNA-binding domain-containing protein [Gammaproteobacteria bacterium]MCW5583049.1 putative DNA-binding domain-containing protein [Gammaproteobacteria bacterium]
MSLQNSQAEFFEILFSNDEQQIDSFYPIQNITIYRNNIKATLIKTLLDTYPMVAKLVGEDFFRTTAKEYILYYPSRSSNLHDYGEYFDVFLTEYLPVKNLAYLAEVAKFEWYCHLLHFAANHAPFDIKKLENVSPDQYDSLHFILHPASYIVKFQYPLLQIVDLCKNQLNGCININEGGINLLLIRRDLDIMLAPLSEVEFSFLSALREELPLSDALKAALLIDPTFRLKEKLLTWIQDKTIVDFYNRSR